jgi:hypothetical protein
MSTRPELHETSVRATPVSVRQRPARATRLALRIALCAGVAMAASGCGGRSGLGNLFGVTLEQPDPFNVLPRSPLRLPANFQDLPSPRPGAPSPLDPTPVADAKSALNAPAPTRGAPSAAELALLDAAGAQNAEDGIRERLATESVPTTRKYGLTSLFGYAVPDGTADEMLDQREEAKRILAGGGATPTPPPAAPTDASNELTLGVF